MRIYFFRNEVDYNNNHIRNSNVIPKENKNESSQLEELFRNLDIDAVQGVEYLVNYQKELVNYPRSVSFYQAKSDDRGRQIIETLSNSNKKVNRFIYFCEMLENFRILYKKIDRIIKNLKAFLDGTPISYNTESSGDSWLITFTYHHSTHKVTMDLNTEHSTKSSSTQLLEGITFGAIISIIVMTALFLVLRKGRGKTDT